LLKGRKILPLLLFANAKRSWSARGLVPRKIILAIFNPLCYDPCPMNDEPKFNTNFDNNPQPNTTPPKPPDIIDATLGPGFVSYPDILPRLELREPAFRKYEYFLAKAVQGSYRISAEEVRAMGTTKPMNNRTFKLRITDAKTAFERFGYKSKRIPPGYPMRNVKFYETEDGGVQCINLNTERAAVHAHKDASSGDKVYPVNDESMTEVYNAVEAPPVDAASDPKYERLYKYGAYFSTPTTADIEKLREFFQGWNIRPNTPQPGMTHVKF